MASANAIGPFKRGARLSVMTVLGPMKVTSARRRSRMAIGTANRTIPPPGEKPRQAGRPSAGRAHGLQGGRRQ
jgi:hypothetical protein